jgi:hypothetical protein
VTSLTRFWCAALGVLACGCSQPVYHVSGTVTFAGKPVETGRIEFVPDASQGNNGPPGHTVITRGTFDTSKKGQGHVGGPMVIRIDGFEVNPDNPKLFGNPLFLGYEIKLDMPKETSEKTLDVPASARETLSKSK